MWVKKGKQPYVLTKSQHHKRLNVFGWVDPIGGKHGMLRQEKGNTAGFLVMLKKILYRYKEIIIELWVDQARWHKGKRVAEFVSKRPSGEPCDMKKQPIHIMRHLKNW
jgi:hypothetical protein